MSRFTAHLGLMQLQYSSGRPARRDGRALWHLPTPLPYEQGAKGSGRLLTVPAFDPSGLTDDQIDLIVRRIWRPRGVTDLGSIPWFGRPLVSPDDAAVKAFVLHDDGYVTQGASWEPILGRPATRAEVDRELKIAAAALGMPPLKRELVYAAVRIGGTDGWGR